MPLSPQIITACGFGFASQCSGISSTNSRDVTGFSISTSMFCVFIIGSCWFELRHELFDVGENFLGGVGDMLASGIILAQLIGVVFAQLPFHLIAELIELFVLGEIE